QSLHDALPILIAAVTLAVGVAHRGIGAAAVGEAGSKDIAGAHALIIDVLFLIQHIELVTLADLPGKVHVIAENVGHLHGQVMRQASILGGDEQRAGDAAAGETGADFGLDDVLAEYKAVAVAFDMNGLEAVHLGAQAEQVPLLVKLELQLLASAQARKGL